MDPELIFLDPELFVLDADPAKMLKVQLNFKKEMYNVVQQ